MSRLKKRTDNTGRVLKDGEDQRKNGTYRYTYTNLKKQRKCIYAKNLEDLRQKEMQINIDMNNRINSDNNYTINHFYEIWKKTKRGINDNTMQNYRYMYEHYVENDIGRMKIKDLRNSHVRAFYNSLYDNKNVAISTIDCVHTILHQVIDIAVNDDYIYKNSSDRALTELKRARALERSKNVRALTQKECKMLIDAVSCKKYSNWRPLVITLMYTGMRISEAIALTWDDIDFKKREISINHNAVYVPNPNTKKSQYYLHEGTKNTKKDAKDIKTRIIPLPNIVIDALNEQKENLKKNNIECVSDIDGYNDFVFLTKDGKIQKGCNINRALERIVRDYNFEKLDKNKDDLLPHVHCHMLRHCYATLLNEINMNMKTRQIVLGHRDIQTTMNIYTDVDNDFNKAEIVKIDDYLKERKIV